MARSRVQEGIEFLAVCAFLAGMGMVLVRLIAAFAAILPGHPWRIVGLAALPVVGYLGSDFFSGFAHFVGDTFFSPKTPLIGPAFIFPFRDHHVHPEAITTHGFLETNGNNSIVGLPAVLVAYLLAPSHPFVSTALFFFLLAMFGTNQFHKWAHQKHPGPIVARLQNADLVLSPTRHALHHTPPYDGDFCITVGWLNPVLERLRFFPVAHRWLGRILPDGRSE